MSITARLTRALTPRVGSLAPNQNSAVIHRSLAHAIDGVGPLPGAAASAESHPSADALVGFHLRLAATQGFLTNLGGIATMPATVPANLAGLALVQTHLIAGIAHLGGHDLADPGVRDAVLACLLGADRVDSLIDEGALPGTPRELAAGVSGPTSTDSELGRRIAAEVTRELVGRVTGRRLAGVVGRRVPVLGGAVGAASDARSTKRLGAYAASQLLDGGRGDMDHARRP